MVEKTLIDRTTRGIKMEKALDVALRYLRKIGPPAALLTFLLLSKAGIDWFSNLDPMFQPPISTPTLPTGTATPQPTPVSSPTPDWTPTTTLSSLRLVTNPFTHVIYQLDVDGCAVIPSGGTAYGAATVLGDPNSPLDVSPLQFVSKKGVVDSPVNRPNDLPNNVQPQDKVCPAGVQ